MSNTITIINKPKQSVKTQLPLLSVYIHASPWSATGLIANDAAANLRFPKSLSAEAEMGSGSPKAALCLFEQGLADYEKPSTAKCPQMVPKSIRSQPG